MKAKALWTALIFFLILGCSEYSPSIANTVPQVSSDISQSDFSFLRKQLANRDFRAADNQTWKILARQKKIDCKTIKVLSEDWMKASNGQYGFKRQAQIWSIVLTESKQSQKKTGNPVAAADTVNLFCSKIGWGNCSIQPNSAFYASAKSPGYLPTTMLLIANRIYDNGVNLVPVERLAKSGVKDSYSLFLSLNPGHEEELFVKLNSFLNKPCF
jgi:GUN4-like